MRHGIPISYTHLIIVKPKSDKKHLVPDNDYEYGGV